MSRPQKNQQAKLEEEEFLKKYSAQDFERPSVTVDVVLLTLQEKHLHVLLLRRKAQPYKDAWALPGTFVGTEETLEAAASRALQEKTGLKNIYLEQLYSFGAPKRDPRMRIISVAYMALVQPEKLLGLKNNQHITLAEIKNNHIRLAEKNIGLAFDHNEIIGTAVGRLRGKLEYTDVGYEFLAKQFTLRELLDVHQIILGRRINKDAFRRKLLQSGHLIATGAFETGKEFRPAEYYKHNPRSTS